MVLVLTTSKLDRNSITQARLYGLEQDAHVSGAMWQTSISILSVGYIGWYHPAVEQPRLQLTYELRNSHAGACNNHDIEAEAIAVSCESFA